MTPSQPKLRLKDKRRRLVWIKVAAGAAVVALSFGLIVYGANRPEVNINNVTVTGAELAKSELVKKVVDATLERSYLNLIPQTNVALVPYSRIEQAIAQSFPQVASVAVSQGNIGELTVALTERTPVALWCAGESLEPDAKEKCYLMDGSGYVFDDAEELGEFISYRGYIESAPIGKQYLDNTFRNFSKAIAELAEASGRKITAVTVDENSDVFVTLEDGGDIIFKLQAEYQDLMDNVASVFASERFKTVAELEYADFRFGNKVYVRFKGE